MRPRYQLAGLSFSKLHGAIQKETEKRKMHLYSNNNNNNNNNYYYYYYYYFVSV